MNSKIIIFLTLLFSSTLFGFSYDIELSQKQLQEKIEKKFPFKKKKFFTTITLTKPKVNLKDASDKIYINLDITINVTKKISFDAYTELDGNIYYDNDSKKFYLKDFKINELVMDKVPLKSIKLSKTHWKVFLQLY